jgi:hypothetical protein
MSVRAAWLLLALLFACADSARERDDAPGADAGHSADGGDPFTEPSPIVEHDIAWGLSCPERAFPANFGVRFGSTCTSVFGGEGELECTAVIECTSDSECAAEPFGRCVGSGRTHCSYAFEQAACAVDADCTALPGGACPSYSREIFCLPSGQCDERPRLCAYPALNATCEADADCDAVPGGRCDKTIERSACHHHGCAADGDCAGEARCECRAGEGRVCVFPTCSGDSDCETGQRCVRPSDLGMRTPDGSFCTTPDDECSSDADCRPEQRCFRDSSSPRFTCEDVS